MRIDGRDGQLLLAQAGRALQAPERGWLSEPRIRDGRGRKDCPHALRALVRRVHLEDMKARRDDKFIFVRDKERVQAVDELRDIRHDYFVGVTIERVEREAR